MLKATIIPTNFAGGQYPGYYTENDGVKVGPAGELTLVAAFDEKGINPQEYRIYAPGAWVEINVEQVND